MRPVIILLLCSILGAVEDPVLLVAEHLKESTAALADLRAAAETAAKLTVDDEVPAARWHLTLPALILWHDRWGHLKQTDLKVTLLPTTGGVLAEAGRADEWSFGRHPVDASGITRTGNHLAGSLRIQLHDRPVPQWVTIDLAATISTEGITGTWTCTDGGLVRPGTGNLEGRVEQVSFAPQAPPKPDDDIMLSEGVRRAIALDWVDRAAVHYYRVVRTYVAARDGGVAPAVAWTRFGEPPLVWPLLEQVRAAKKKPPKQPSKKGLDLPEDPFATPGTGEGDLVAEHQAILTAAGDVTARLRLRARAAGAALSQAAPTVLTGDTALADPAFGPWFGGPVLLPNQTAANQLPATAVDAPQAWSTVAGWTCVGPFPQHDRLLTTSRLPDAFPSLALKTLRDTRDLRSPGKNAEDVGPFTCLGSGLVEAGSGRVQLPLFLFTNDHGINRWDCPNSTWYVATTLDSATAGPRWCGITASDHLQVWIDDVLAWTTPPIRDLRRREQTWRVELLFRQGVNRVVVRLDNDLDDVWFRLRICTAGAPRSAAAAEAAEAVIARDLTAAGSPTAGTQGFRNDGTGHYDGRPPLAWNPFDGTNVRWQTPLGFSYATPLVVGDQVITLEDPQSVVALDRQTGAVRWRTDCDIVLTRDSELQRQAVEVKAAAAKAQGELNALGPGRREQVQTFINGGQDQAVAEEAVKRLEREARSYDGFLASKCGVQQVGWYRDIGHTYATPVTDGTHLWVKSNTGTLACLDLAGRIVWLVDHGHSSKELAAAVSSPLLMGDRLLLFFPEEVAAKPESRSVNVVLGYDAVTGKRRWRTETPHAGDQCGSLAALRLSDGTTRRDVVVTPNGAVVAVDDGALLCGFLGSAEVYGTPLAVDHDTVVIGANRQKTAYRLRLGTDGTLGVETRWSLDSFGFFQDGNYGLGHDGKLSYSRPGLDVCRLDDGRVLGTIGAPFFCPRNGRGYPPCVLAGGHLFLADNAQWFAPTNRPNTSAFPGGLSVILPGEPGVVLARNQIRQIHGGFSVHGDALYTRSRDELACFALTGEAGRRYEAATVAREILTQFFPERPGDGEPVAIAAATAQEVKGAVRFDAGDEPDAWILAGPFDSTRADAVAAELSTPEWIGVKDGATCADAPTRHLHGGNMGDWRRSDMFDLTTFNGSALKHIGWDSLTNPEIDLPKLSGVAAGRSLAFATRVACPYQRILRVDSGHPAARAWVGGRPVAHNTAVVLSPGLTAVVIVVAIDDLDGDRRLLRPRLWPSHGPADAATWVKDLTSLKPYLQTAVDLVGETPVGHHAERVLGQVP